MQTQLRDKNDIKLFILYLMRHVGYPLNFQEVSDIVIQDGIVGYFNFQECFAELLDAGTVEELKIDGEPYYSITPRGIHVADNLDSPSLNLIKERSLKSALRIISFKRRGDEIRCTYEELPGDRYIVNCIVIENREELLNVKLLLESKLQLEKIRINFNDKPEIIYRGILSLLSGEVNYLIN
ncbi:MAG: DUF4364 family protein [Firmicutes bacterium]|nr:DUF4364 family protein [Bacillota bacterium]